MSVVASAGAWPWLILISCSGLLYTAECQPTSVLIPEELLAITDAHLVSWFSAHDGMSVDVSRHSSRLPGHDWRQSRILDRSLLRNVSPRQSSSLLNAWQQRMDLSQRTSTSFMVRSCYSTESSGASTSEMVTFRHSDIIYAEVLSSRKPRDLDSMCGEIFLKYRICRSMLKICWIFWQSRRCRFGFLICPDLFRAWYLWILFLHRIWWVWSLMQSFELRIESLSTDRLGCRRKDVIWACTCLWSSPPNPTPTLFIL